MKLGIFVPSIGNYGNNKFYNSQEIGLAKALSNYYEEIIIYKLIDKKNRFQTEIVDGYKNIKIVLIPSRRIGSNGIINTKLIDKSINSLICFSDLQLFIPRIYKWCKKRNIKFIPYVGTIESSLNSKMKKVLRNVLLIPLYRIYRENVVLAKTAYVKEKLNEKRINNVIIAPIGLDIEKIDQNSSSIKSKDIIKKYNLENYKVMLMVSRLESDRSPIDSIELLRIIYEKNKNYKLIIIGNGILDKEIRKRISEYGLDNNVVIINRVKNEDMKEYYKASDLMITFNRNEIFGMSILEAMYNMTPVYAMHAPGPDFIIKNGEDGYLFYSVKDMANKILKNDDNPSEIMQNAKNKILNEFTWNKTASIIYKVLNSEVK